MILFSGSIIVMLKKLLISLCLIFSIPAFAGQLENALKNNQNVFLYIYKEDCGLRQQFNPVYKKISKKHNNKFGFLKISADTSYGRQLAAVYNVRFVPFVVMIHSDDKNSATVDPRCLINEACISRVLNNFSSSK